MARQWIPIPGFEGCYEVSSLGEVRSWSFGAYTKLKPSIREHGYARVILCWAGRSINCYVHILVATSFLGKKPGRGYQVHHKDGNKKNNRVSNLKWVTPAENSRATKALNPKAYTSKYHGVSLFQGKWRASLWVKPRILHLGTFDTELAAAKAYDKACFANFQDRSRLNFKRRSK